MDGVTSGTFPPMLRAIYEAVSPDGPEHFPVVVASCTRRGRATRESTWPGWPT